MSAEAERRLRIWLLVSAWITPCLLMSTGPPSGEGVGLLLLDLLKRCLVLLSTRTGSVASAGPTTTELASTDYFLLLFAMTA